MHSRSTDFSSTLVCVSGSIYTRVVRRTYYFFPWPSKSYQQQMTYLFNGLQCIISRCLHERGLTFCYKTPNIITQIKVYCTCSTPPNISVLIQLRINNKCNANFITYLQLYIYNNTRKILYIHMNLFYKMDELILLSIYKTFSSFVNIQVPIP